MAKSAKDKKRRERAVRRLMAMRERRTNAALALHRLLVKLEARP